MALVCRLQMEKKVDKVANSFKMKWWRLARHKHLMTQKIYSYEQLTTNRFNENLILEKCLNLGLIKHQNQQQYCIVIKSRIPKSRFAKITLIKKTWLNFVKFLTLVWFQGTRKEWHYTQAHKLGGARRGRGHQCAIVNLR